MATTMQINQFPILMIHELTTKQTKNILNSNKILKWMLSRCLNIPQFTVTILLIQIFIKNMTMDFKSK